MRARGVAAPLLAVAVAGSIAPAPAQSAAIDRFAALAQKRYQADTSGSVVHLQLSRIAGEAKLRDALAANSASRVHFYVRSAFVWVWNAWPVSRVRVLRGPRTLVEAGVPFCLAPSVQTLHNAHGGYLGTLEVASQDVGGFVASLHRDYPIDVVVRGRGPAHVRTTLPAARTVALPARGPVTVAGRRYVTRSFAAKAWDREPIRIWILQRARG